MVNWLTVLKENIESVKNGQKKFGTYIKIYDFAYGNNSEIYLTRGEAEVQTQL